MIHESSKITWNCIRMVISIAKDAIYIISLDCFEYGKNDITLKFTTTHLLLVLKGIKVK